MTTRRGFIQGLLALAAAQAIPFNRVWSFPKEIVIVKPKTTYLVGQNAVVNATIGEWADYYPPELVKINTFQTYNIRYTILPPISKREIKFYKYKLENI